MSDPRFVVVDETTWPIDRDGEAGWCLRYGTTDLREERRLFVAFIVDAYASLLDPNRPAGDAIAMLRRARRAAASEPAEPEPQPPAGSRGETPNG